MGQVRFLVLSSLDRVVGGGVGGGGGRKIVHDNHTSARCSPFGFYKHTYMYTCVHSCMHTMHACIETEHPWDESGVVGSVLP